MAALGILRVLSYPDARGGADVVTPYDESAVPITAWLPGAVYRPLAQLAQRHGVTVGQLLTELARRTISPTQPRPKAWVRTTPQQMAQIAQLRTEGRSPREIILITGIPRSTVYKHLGDLNDE